MKGGNIRGIPSGVEVSLCALRGPFIWRYRVRLDNAGFRLKKARVYFHDFLKAVQPLDAPGHAPVRWYSKTSNLQGSSSAHQGFPGSKYRIGPTIIH